MGTWYSKCPCCGHYINRGEELKRPYGCPCCNWNSGDKQ